MPREQAGLSIGGLEDEGERVWDDDFWAHGTQEDRQSKDNIFGCSLHRFNTKEMLRDM